MGLPPDVNESDAEYTPRGIDIRFGLAAIRNVGEGVVACASDDLEDDDFDSYGRGEDRSAVERRLALEKLEEKAFETVRQDTI